MNMPTLIKGEKGGPAVIALVRSEAMAAELQGWCREAGLGLCDIRVTPAPASAITTVDWTGARVAIVETGVPDGPGLAQVELLIDLVPQDASVIAVVEAPTSSDIRRLFRAGVTDVLPGSTDLAEFRTAFDAAIVRAGNIGTPSDRSGKLYLMLKSAGGVGATTLGANLAREFLHLGAGRVAVVDMDVQFGNIGTALDLEPRMDLTDAIRAGSRLDGTMLHSMMTRHATGIDALPGGKTIAPADVLTEDFVSAFCTQIKFTHDHVIFDMPISWAPWFHAAIEASDVVIPVVEPSVRCAHGARRIVQALEDLELTGTRLVPLTNRVDRVPAGKERLRRIGEILGVPCDLTIRDDDKMAQVAADKGQCWRETNAGAPISQDIEAVSRKVLSIVDPAVVPAGRPRQTAGAKFSFFGGRL